METKNEIQSNYAKWEKYYKHPGKLDARLGLFLALFTDGILFLTLVLSIADFKNLLLLWSLIFGIMIAVGLIGLIITIMMMYRKRKSHIDLFADYQTLCTDVLNNGVSASYLFPFSFYTKIIGIEEYRPTSKEEILKNYRKFLRRSHRYIDAQLEEIAINHLKVVQLIYQD